MQSFSQEACNHLRGQRRKAGGKAELHSTCEAGSLQKVVIEACSARAPARGDAIPRETCGASGSSLQGQGVVMAGGEESLVPLMLLALIFPALSPVISV